MTLVLESTSFLFHVSILLSPTVFTFASVTTSKNDGTVSVISIELSSTNDSMSIRTSNEFGLVIGSILLCAVLIISNSK